MQSRISVRETRDLPDALWFQLDTGRSTTVLDQAGRRSVKGYLDEVSLSTIKGWAIDARGQPPNLIASINGVPVARFQPTIHREDLVEFGQRNLGFEIELGYTVNQGDVVSITDEHGEHLVGSPRRIVDLTVTREEKILHLISRDMKILEIGPSYNPIAPRSRGWNSFSLDHCTQEELKAKYRGQQAVDRVEHVDYVWNRGPLETAVPVEEHGSFDAIIASHIIEHMPDPIGFFLSASVLVGGNGILSLVIPDKRTMFDFFKPVTLTSDYLMARYLSRTRHSKKTAFDNIAYNVSESGDVAWFPRVVGSFGFFGTNVLADAKHAFDNTSEDDSSEYVDFHGTVYTPSSFSLIVLELGQLGILPFNVACTFPTSNCEFYVTLRKGVPIQLEPSVVQQERLRLMRATVKEVGEQAAWLLNDESGDL